MILPPLTPQPADTPWPTLDWPVGVLPPGIAAPVQTSVSHAFSAESTATLGVTHALLIIHQGRLVLEHYAPDFGPQVTCPSWSMAKSITHALAGLLVADGVLDIHAPAGVPEWAAAGDARGAITLDQLLRMSSGLAFAEDYDRSHPSDVIEMLFGKGQGDVAGFAAALPLEHAPGAHWSYSSGTTNIVSRCLSEALARSGGGSLQSFMQERLFAPLGITSAIPKFDAAGTFIGSSFCFCTPRDFARFGLLYLRDGIWDGRRILPQGWIDYARTATFQQIGSEAQGRYGASWWLDIAGPGSFSANGYDGQFIVLCPDRDLIIVRHGATPEPLGPNLKAWIKDLAGMWA